LQSNFANCFMALGAGHHSFNLCLNQVHLSNATKIRHLW
jgi:hypothetical protein